MHTTRNSEIYLLFMIGSVSALGPFVTDFYLPALPALTGYFSATTSLVQLSLTCSMIGLAAGQLFIGPLSDKYGCKRPLIISMAAFCLSTLCCLLSPDIHAFLFFRLIQGLAGAGGLVISRSIVSDLYQGQALSRFFSLLSAVQGLAPICAPVLGGILLKYTDWRGIFVVLLAIGLLLTLLLFRFRESLPKRLRVRGGIGATFRHYLPVLQNKRFMGYILVQAFAMGVMFSYISASPFIFQEHFGLTPFAYSLCFGVNALAIMAGSLLASRFASAVSALKTGVRGFLLMGCVTATAFLFGPAGIVETALVLLLFCLGLILPSSTALALELERHNSGYASALLGFLSFLSGGIVSPLTGLGDILRTTAILTVLCCFAAWTTEKGTRLPSNAVQPKRP